MVLQDTQELSFNDHTHVLKQPGEETETSQGCLIYLSTVMLVQFRYCLAVAWFLCRLFFTKRPVDAQRQFIATNNMKTSFVVDQKLRTCLSW